MNISHFLGDASTGTFTDAELRKQEQDAAASTALWFGGAVVVGAVVGGLVGNAFGGHKIAGAIIGGVLGVPLLFAEEVTRTGRVG